MSVSIAQLELRVGRLLALYREFPSSVTLAVYEDALQRLHDARDDKS